MSEENGERYAVCISWRGSVFAVVESYAEAEEVMHGMTHLNRWFMEDDREPEIREVDDDTPVTDPFKRGWIAQYRDGWAGWMLEPVAVGRGVTQEGVSYHSTKETKVYVRAPSAVLAIERAKLLLTTVKKHREER